MGKYTVNRLGEDNQNQVFCYERDFYVFSNFSAFMIKWSGDTFPTSEHAYQAEKFRNHHITTYNAIKEAPSAHEAFKLAQENKHLADPDWDEKKFDVMVSILLEKAIQHRYVLQKLVQTGDREIIEDSWRDDVWGWGPNKDGKNLLGKAWMEVRTNLITRL